MRAQVIIEDGTFCFVDTDVDATVDSCERGLVRGELASAASPVQAVRQIVRVARGRAVRGKRHRLEVGKDDRFVIESRPRKDPIVELS
jgi:hypothetical protein